MGLKVNGATIDKVYCNGTYMESVVQDGSLRYIRPYESYEAGGLTLTRALDSGSMSSVDEGLRYRTKYTVTGTAAFKTIMVRFHIPDVVLTDAYMDSGLLPHKGATYIHYIINGTVYDFGSSPADQSASMQNKVHWSGSFGGNGILEFAWEQNNQNPFSLMILINGICAHTEL